MPRKLYVFARRVLQVGVHVLRNALNSEEVMKRNKKLYNYIYFAAEYRSTIDGVFLFAHPVTEETNVINTSTWVVIACLGVTYTIYEKLDDNDNGGGGDDDDDDVVVVHKHVADLDQFSFVTDQYKTHRFRPRSFFSEASAHQEVVANPARFFNNKHDMLTEFISNANSRFVCFRCKVNRTDQRCSDCGHQFVCLQCHDHSEAAKTPVTRTVVLDRDDLDRHWSAVKMNGPGHFVFAKEELVDREYITLCEANELPWEDPLLLSLSASSSDLEIHVN